LIGARLTGRMPRTPIRSLTLALALALAVPAFGAPADGVKPKPRRTPPAAKPAASLALRPAVGPPPPLAPLPPPMQSGAAFASGAIAQGGLASHGLRSMLAPVGDARPQCRAKCSEKRIDCDAQEGTPDCAPRWSDCIAACSR
jgi:hypothetical protein